MKDLDEKRLRVLCKKRVKKGFTHEEHKELRALERKCQLKQCSKCGQLLSVNCFAKNKSTKDGLSSPCKECKKQYYQDNEESIKKQNKQYRQDNKGSIKECKKQYYQDNEESIKQYRQDNKGSIKEYKKQYDQDNKGSIKEYKKQYDQDNKENRNEYQNKRYIEDPKFRLNRNMSAAIRQSLKTQAISKNGRRWEMLVGYTTEELMAHLEGKFQFGMTWENHGDWHVDHIKPISLFDFERIDDPGFKECWALKNLQPLWAEDNLSKGNKYKEAHTQDKQVGYKVVETS